MTNRRIAGVGNRAVNDELTGVDSEAILSGLHRQIFATSRASDESKKLDRFAFGKIIPKAPPGAAPRAEGPPHKERVSATCEGSEPSPEPEMAQDAIKQVCNEVRTFLRYCA